MNKIDKRLRKIMQVYLKSQKQVRPHFFLTGPTGSGKTHTITKIADELSIPVISVNTAQITNEGLAGNSISKTLEPLSDHEGQAVIVFFDEFDKAIAAENELTSGSVQAELLKLLEDSTTEVFGSYGKYNRVSVDNVLFVFAGSFNGIDIDSPTKLQELGVIPELIGRVGLHYTVEKASLEELMMLVERSPLLKNYIGLMDGISHAKAVSDISAELAAQFDSNMIGIRLINSLIHQYFIDGGFMTVTTRKLPEAAAREVQLLFTND